MGFSKIYMELRDMLRKQLNHVQIGWGIAVYTSRELVENYDNRNLIFSWMYAWEPTQLFACTVLLNLMQKSSGDGITIIPT